MFRFAHLSPLKALAYGSAAAAFALSVSLLSLSQTPHTEPAAASVTAEYYAALSGWQVVIYQHGRTQPILHTEIDVRTLPDADRKLLEAGLPLANVDAVSRLLEDYGS